MFMFYRVPTIYDFNNKKNKKKNKKKIFKKKSKNICILHLKITAVKSLCLYIVYFLTFKTCIKISNICLSRLLHILSNIIHIISV